MDISNIKIRKEISTEELLRDYQNVIKYFDYWKDMIDKIPSSKPLTRHAQYKHLMERLIEYTSDFYEHYIEVLSQINREIKTNNDMLVSILVNYLPNYIGDPISVFERAKVMERPVTLSDALADFISKFFRLNVNPDTLKTLIDSLIKKRGNES